MQSVPSKLTIYILLFLIIGFATKGYGQNTSKEYNVYSDTLIVIGDLVVNKSKILLSREDFFSVDSLFVNQNGFAVASFKMNALALGVNVSLSSNSNAVTAEMKNEIINGHTKYKFIYLKDILLRGGNGKEYLPSTKSIKVVFKN